MAVNTLPFPTLIPVDGKDLKSLELSVDEVAPESAFLIGGDTALTADVSDLPQRTEGGVTGQTETASRSHRSNETASRSPSCLRGPKEESPVERDRFKKSNNYKTLVTGPAFPMKSEDNPNKRET